MLRFPPGVGRSTAKVALPLAAHVSPSAACDVGLITFIGTILDPRFSLKRGYAVWQCTLSQTHVGKSGAAGATVDTQLLELRCVGECASVAATFERGLQVAVVGRLLHRPKFIAATASYDHRSEILVSDTLGSLTRL